ncbi:MAG: hypothetical protein A2Z18_02545 [Armatimonadetes bacterium RBG_16_58_9]|nr:MAG: hypothetical protein A2Z18_02545 [Armatimonadetes bacterium RBG_16_58_9]
MAWPTNWSTGEPITAERLTQWTNAQKVLPGDVDANGQSISNVVSLPGAADLRLARQVRIGTDEDVTVSGTGTMHITGNTQRILTASRTPTGSSDTGNDGEICFDDNYIYVRIGGSWRRAAIATW